MKEKRENVNQIECSGQAGLSLHFWVLPVKVERGKEEEERQRSSRSRLPLLTAFNAILVVLNNGNYQHHFFIFCIDVDYQKKAKIYCEYPTLHAYILQQNYLLLPNYVNYIVNVHASQYSVNKITKNFFLFLTITFFSLSHQLCFWQWTCHCLLTTTTDSTTWRVRKWKPNSRVSSFSIHRAPACRWFVWRYLLTISKLAKKRNETATVCGDRGCWYFQGQ